MAYSECVVANCGNSVFSTGLCRKHWEQERLLQAAPCSFSGCSGRAYRGILCVTHYRAKIRAAHPLCTVPHCGQPQKTLSSGFCEKHLFRFSRHGSVEQPRGVDWGAREAHPLYQTWCWHKRRTRTGLCPEWQADFWAFVQVVGEKPAAHTLRRLTPTQPLGPANWKWKRSIPCKDKKDKAEYSREWRRENPDKAKNIDLKKAYGIGLPEYQYMAKKQGYVCAICKRPNMGKDRAGLPRYMSVDHCHETGKVRALLCEQCNRGLGIFLDSPDLLRAAALYIEAHRACLPTEIVYVTPN